MRLILVAVAGAALLVAGSAEAQYSTNAGTMRAESALRMDRFGQQLAEHALDSETQPAEQNSGNQNPRRLRRARHAAEMINNNDCAGARAYAVTERDQRLVDRIDQICTPSANPAASAVPAPPRTPAPH